MSLAHSEGLRAQGSGVLCLPLSSRYPCGMAKKFTKMGVVELGLARRWRKEGKTDIVIAKLLARDVRTITRQLAIPVRRRRLKQGRPVAIGPAVYQELLQELVQMSHFHRMQILQAH